MKAASFWVSSSDIGYLYATSFGMVFKAAQALGEKIGRVVSIGDGDGPLASMWREPDGTFVAQPGPRFAEVRAKAEAEERPS